MEGYLGMASTHSKKERNKDASSSSHPNGQVITCLAVIMTTWHILTQVHIQVHVPAYTYKDTRAMHHTNCHTCSYDGKWRIQVSRLPFYTISKLLHSKEARQGKKKVNTAVPRRQSHASHPIPHVSSNCTGPEISDTILWWAVAYCTCTVCYEKVEGFQWEIV